MNYKIVCCLLTAVLVSHPLSTMAEEEPTDTDSIIQAAQEDQKPADDFVNGEEIQEDILKRKDEDQQTDQVETPVEAVSCDNAKQAEVTDEPEIIGEPQDIGGQETIEESELVEETETTKETETTEEAKTMDEAKFIDEEESGKKQEKKTEVDLKEEDQAEKTSSRKPEQEDHMVLKEQEEKKIRDNQDERKEKEQKQKEEQKQRAETKLNDEQKQQFKKEKIVKEQEKENKNGKLQQPVFPARKVFFKNIRNLSSNPKQVKPEVIIENPILDDEQLEIILESKSQGVIPKSVQVHKENGKVRYSIPDIDKDDQYILKLKNKRTDSPYEEAVAFSVNRRGTTFTYDQEKANVKLDQSFSPVIHLQNVDATQVITCMVNGKECSYEEKGDELLISEDNLKYGKNQIIVAVKDQAGNISVMSPWEFMISSEKKQDKKAEIHQGVKENQNIVESLTFLLRNVVKMIARILGSSI